MKNTAPFYLRAIAFITDLMIMSALYLFVLLFTVSASTIQTTLDRLLMMGLYWLIILPILVPFIQAIMISQFGGTIGKLATGTQILDAKGRRLTPQLAFFRNFFGYTISGLFLGLGFWWSLKDPEKRTWHDLITNSYVVVKNKTGLLVGSILLSGVILLNGMVLVSTVGQFWKNVPLYQNTVLDVIDETSKKIEAGQRSLKSSPSPRFLQPQTPSTRNSPKV